MNTTISIYTFTDDEKLKGWSNSLLKTLVSTSQLFHKVTSDNISIEKFNGKLTNSNYHIFVFSENKFVEINNLDSTSNCFQIHLTPVEYKNIPAALSKTPFYEFFTYSNIEQTTNWSTFNTNDTWSQVLDLTKELFSIYKKDKGNVYLAKTSPDQSLNREKIKQDLLNRGYDVYPKHPLNSSKKEIFEQEITSQLNNISLSVHILGNYQSVEKTDIVDIQNKICAKESKNEFNRLIWLPSDLTLDKTNQEKISLLQKDLELLKGAEFVDAPLELFKSLIYQKLTSQLSNKNELKNGLYFIFDDEKDSAIDNIKKNLKQAKVDLLESSSDYSPLINHKNNLNNSDGVLIYYNGSNHYWIESILNDIIKSPKYRDNKNNAITILGETNIELKPEIERYNLNKIELQNKPQFETFIKNLENEFSFNK